MDGLQRLSADDLLKLTETQLNGIADKVSALFAQLDAIDKAYEEYRELQQTMKAKLLDRG